MRAISVFLAVAVALVALGCGDNDDSASAGTGGSTGSGGTGASSGAAGTNADRCRESCEAYAQCEGFPLSGCAGTISCDGWPANNWREEVASAYLQCLKECPNNPEECSDAAFDAAGASRTIDNEYASACEEKRAACTGSFRNDTCGEESLYLESAVESALACLNEPCTMVSNCVDAVFE
jgi:hypothetical protein